MARLNLRLCYKLLPATAMAASSVAGRGALATAFHYHRPTYQYAFGSTSRGVSSEDSPGGKGARNQQLHSTVQGAPGNQLQDLAAASPSLLAKVVAVASDIDGTLTRPDVSVASRTKAAIKAVMDSGLVFFPATGKTRAGMYQVLGEDVGSQLRANNAPGVFIQGLVVYSGSGNEVLYERLLDADIVAQVASFCEERGVSLIAYSGDRIVCSKKDAQTDKIAHYDEPMPSAVGSISEAMASGLKVHKLIVMAATETIDEIRPEVEQLIGAKATFTQALPDMLEVLPPGASKGHGVEILLKYLGIDPLCLMALGDAENDVEMLRLAGIGVCVGNASPPARAAARFVAPTNVENGAAVAMEQLLNSKQAEVQ